MIMGAENQVHVTFQPNDKTPREVILRAQGSHFEKIQSQSPQLGEFYAQENEFNCRYGNSGEQDFEVSYSYEL
jgi:hypothetical protein